MIRIQIHPSSSFNIYGSVLSISYQFRCQWAFTSGNAISYYFIILKNYFINYIISFYNTFSISTFTLPHSKKKKNFYFTILEFKIIYLHNKIIYLHNKITIYFKKRENETRKSSIVLLRPSKWDSGETKIIIFEFAIGYNISAKLQWYCSIIVHFFAIHPFGSLGVGLFLRFNSKSVLHMAFGRPDVNALICLIGEWLWYFSTPVINKQTRKHETWVLM